jgi:formate-dependent nitrite reductase membrane component NrfD
MLSDLMIAYLFLGGAGAGAFFILIILDLLSPRASLGKNPRRYSPRAAYRPLFASGYLLSGGVLILGVLCLLFDLGRPDRLLLLFMRPSMSYLTLGSYTLVITVVCVVVLGMIWSVSASRVPRWLVRAIQVLGLVMATVTMLYTGLLFFSIGTGTLLGTVLIPAVFVLSSLSTGIALLLVTAAFTRAGGLFATAFTRLARVDVILILLEALGIALLLLFSLEEQLPREAVASLTRGDSALLFWFGVIGCGIVAPLCFEGTSLFRGAWAAIVNRVSLFAPSAVLLLVGGYCLRLSLLNTGLPVFSVALVLGIS